MDVKELFKEIEKYENKEVILEGWVRNNRNQSNFGFIDFNDGTSFNSIQIVYTNKLVKKQNNVLIKANSRDHINDCFVTTFTLIASVLGYYGVLWFDGVVGIGISVWICYLLK